MMRLLTELLDSSFNGRLGSRQSSDGKARALLAEVENIHQRFGCFAAEEDEFGVFEETEVWSTKACHFKVSVIPYTQNCLIWISNSQWNLLGFVPFSHGNKTTLPLFGQKSIYGNVYRDVKMNTDNQIFFVVAFHCHFKYCHLIFN